MGAALNTASLLFAIVILARGVFIASQAFNKCFIYCCGKIRKKKKEKKELKKFVCAEFLSCTSLILPSVVQRRVRTYWTKVCLLSPNIINDVSSKEFFLFSLLLVSVFWTTFQQKDQALSPFKVPLIGSLLGAQNTHIYCYWTYGNLRLASARSSLPLAADSYFALFKSFLCKGVRRLQCPSRWSCTTDPFLNKLCKPRASTSEQKPRLNTVVCRAFFLQNISKFLSKKPPSHPTDILCWVNSSPTGHISIHARDRGNFLFQ